MGQTSEDQDDQKTLNLKADIKVELSQLAGWSIKELRRFYEQFKQSITTSTLLDKLSLSRLLGHPKKTSDFLFEAFGGGERIQFFQLFAGMVLLSYTHYAQKVSFIFSAFDFQGRGYIDLRVVSLCISCFMIGFMRLTGQSIGQPKRIIQSANAIINKYKLASEQFITRSLLVEWIQTIPSLLNFFSRHQPPEGVKITQNIFLLRRFKPFRLQTMSVFNFLTNYQLVFHDKAKLKEFLESTKERKLPKLQGSKESKRKLSHFSRRSVTTVNRKERFIVRGRVYTKRQLFQMRGYFDYLSNCSKQLTPNSLAANLEQTSLIKHLTGDIMEFLDPTQKGAVDFLQFVKRVQPCVSKEQLNIVQRWMQEYDQICSKATRNPSFEVKRKKRKLPGLYLKHLQVLFGEIDQGRKGFITLEDLARVFSYSYSLRETEQLIRRHSTHNLPTLNFEEFANILLPQDYQFD